MVPLGGGCEGTAGREVADEEGGGAVGEGVRGDESALDKRDLAAPGILIFTSLNP